MKQNLFTVALVALLALCSLDSSAQRNINGNWRDRMMSEKIAFITNALQLTPQEAETFWPVYNQIEKEKRDHQMEVIKAYRDLENAVNSGTASEKDLNELLTKYLEVRGSDRCCCYNEDQRLRAALPVEKLAKLYIAEENFRRQHIRNIKGKSQGSGRQEAPIRRPGPAPAPGAQK